MSSLDYVNIDCEGRFKFSPSGFGVFASNPALWYKTHVKKISSFRGNTNTVVGTIIHGRIERYWKSKPIDTQEESEYVSKFESVDEVDSWKVDEEVKRLWEVVLKELPNFHVPTDIEQQVRFDIPESNYTIAGSYDYMIGNTNTLGDIKTTARTPKSITLSHRTQLCMYEMALRGNGITNTHFQVMYIVKTKVPKVVLITEEIDEDYLDSVKQDIKDMITRIELVKDNPELENIVFFLNRDSFIQ